MSVVIATSTLGEVFVWSRNGRSRAGELAPVLAPGDRRLTRETMPNGGLLIATSQALHIGSVDGSWQRIEWCSIRMVSRSRQSAQFQVMTLRLREPAANLTVALLVRERSRIADLVTEFAAAATIVSRRVIMSNSSIVTFSARRQPGSRMVTWSVEFDRDADRDDPLLRNEVVATLRDLRALTGC